jgi:hypothetical protein
VVYEVRLSENRIDRAFCGGIIYNPSWLIGKRFWSLGYIVLSKSEQGLVLRITSDREVFLIDAFVDGPIGVSTVAIDPKRISMDRAATDISLENNSKWGQLLGNIVRRSVHRRE